MEVETVQPITQGNLKSTADLVKVRDLRPSSTPKRKQPTVKVPTTPSKDNPKSSKGNKSSFDKEKAVSSGIKTYFKPVNRVQESQDTVSHFESPAPTYTGLAPTIEEHSLNKSVNLAKDNRQDDLASHNSGTIEDVSQLSPIKTNSFNSTSYFSTSENNGWDSNNTTIEFEPTLSWTDQSKMEIMGTMGVPM